MDDSEEISVYEYEVYPEYDTVEVDLEPNRRQPCTTKTITQTTTVTTPPIHVEAPLPHEHNTNDFLIKETRAELLACTTWQEVEAIIGNLTEDAKGTVWATFTTEQKRAFKGMKIRFAHNIELRDNVSSDANSNSVTNSESNALSQQDALDFGQELSLICN